ncbi:MAG TPA: DUF1778 domain-containing protein, partial [Longimicrobiaceae bacterium]|nr:DUF1778 domain-containing protein [Longimicrobiaceae bacterium]
MARGNTSPREDRMDVRLPREHKALIEKAAAFSGESLTGFAVSTLVREARRIIQEHEFVTLSARDRERFVELLDNPPSPGEALRRAAESHRRLITRS